MDRTISSFVSSAPPIQKLESKWNRICQSYEHFQKYSEDREEKLKTYVRVGIPDSCRGRAWQFLTGSVAMKVPNKYLSLLKQNIPEPIARQIELDLPRTHYKTVSGGKINPNMDAMRHVLTAYAAYDTAVGYVQGMAHVVGVLVQYMNEEDSFWMLVCLMDQYNYHNALIQDFPFVKLCLSQLSRVIRKFTPKLYFRLNPTASNPHSSGFTFPMEFFSAVFVALFADSLPWELLTRVWDSFFFEEWKTIFRFVVGLLLMNEEKLLKLKDDSMLITSLKITSLCGDRDVSTIMAATFKVRLKSRTLFRACNQFNMTKFEEWLDAFDLVDLSQVMQSEKGVEICDRNHLLKTFSTCFVGRQAVDWLLQYMHMGGLSRHCACRRQIQPTSSGIGQPPTTITTTSSSSTSAMSSPPHLAPLNRGGSGSKFLPVSSPPASGAGGSVTRSPRTPNTGTSAFRTAPIHEGPTQPHSPNPLANALPPTPSDPNCQQPAVMVSSPSPALVGGPPPPISVSVSSPSANLTPACPSPNHDNNLRSMEEDDGEEVDSEDDDDEEGPLPAPQKLCWCSAELGMDTQYYNTMISRNTGLLEKERRSKAILILKAMERKGLFYNVDYGKPFVDETHSFYRFTSMCPPTSAASMRGRPSFFGGSGGTAAAAAAGQGASPVSLGPQSGCSYTPTSQEQQKATTSALSAEARAVRIRELKVELLHWLQASHTEPALAQQLEASLQHGISESTPQK